MNRPSNIKAFMQPAKLRIGGKTTDLTISQQSGGQWLIRVQRPGLAQPLIIPQKLKK